MPFKSKKGVYGVAMIGTLALMLGIAAITIAISAEVQENVQDQMFGTDAQWGSCGYNGTAAFNTTCNGLEGTETFANWLPTISLILAAAIVIGILVTSFRTGE